jgi:hypothetical protein
MTCRWLLAVLPWNLCATFQQFMAPRLPRGAPQAHIILSPEPEQH